MKKIYYTFIIIISIGSILFFFTKQSKTIKETKKDLISYNPKNPTLILIGEDLNIFLNKLKPENSNIFKELNKNYNINSIIQRLEDINNLLEYNKNIKHQFSFSLYQNTNKINIFITIEISEIYKIKEKINNKYDNIKIKKFNDQYINNINNKYFFTIINNTLLISSSEILIENSLNQIKKKITLLNDLDLNKIYNTKEEEVVILNYSEIHKLKNKILQHKQNIIKPVLKWSVLDLKLDKNNISLYGFSVDEKNNKNYINIIKNHDAKKIIN